TVAAVPHLAGSILRTALPSSFAYRPPWYRRTAGPPRQSPPHVARCSSIRAAAAPLAGAAMSHERSRLRLVSRTPFAPRLLQRDPAWVQTHRRLSAAIRGQVCPAPRA